MIDTHAHLDFEPLRTNLVEVIQRATEIPLRAIINVGANITSSQNSINLAQHYKNIFASVGIHPDDIHEFENKETEEELELLIKNERVVAVGEIGLDYYRLDPKDMIKKENQQKYFRFQIQLAKKYKLPIIVHSRSSADDILRLVREEQPSKAVMHCFAYDLDFAEKFLALNTKYMISFTGIVTFPNAKTTQDAAKHIPLEKIMIETDSPFLAPQAYRGKTNEPSYVVEVAKKISELKNISVEEVVKKTDSNAISFFGLSI